MNILENNNLWRREVEFLPYIQAFPELAQHHEYDEKKVILSSEHDLLFGIHSSKSFLIRHESALQTVSDCVNLMFGAEPQIEVTSIKSGAIIRAKISLDQFPEVDLGNGDTNKIHLLLNNSYAHASGFKLQLGVFRQVCSNGAVVGQAVAGFNSRQLLDEGFNPTSLQGKVARIIEDSKYLYDLWMSWREIIITYDEALQLFEKKFSDKTLETLLDPNLFPCDLWTLYNILTAYSTHESKTASSLLSTDSLISSIFYGKRSLIRDYDRDTFDIIQEEKLTHSEVELEEDA
jgi:hypothetical protein